MKIFFLIPSLNYGGAEWQLILLAKGLRSRGHDVTVALFTAGWPLEQVLRDAGVKVRSLNKHGRSDVLGFMSRLIRMVWEEAPDIVHSYLLHTNVLAAFVRPFSQSTRIVWGVRCSSMDLGESDWVDTLCLKVSRWLAGWTDAIIANSHAGREYHLACGYPFDKLVTISNGVDTERYRSDPDARHRLRGEWAVKDHEKLVGIVARLDPIKDHYNFLKAASLLAKKRNDIRFVCVGGGPEEYQVQLQSYAKTLELEKVLLWAGHCEDMPSVYNALDVVVSCSHDEGMSNAVCEAMACGVPCVVTNVGDSAWLVGDGGEVVPPRNPSALMSAIERLLDQGTYDPAMIRQRIVEQFSVGSLVTNTERVLNNLLQSPVSNASGCARVKPIVRSPETSR